MDITTRYALEHRATIVLVGDGGLDEYGQPRPAPGRMIEDVPCLYWATASLPDRETLGRARQVIGMMLMHPLDPMTAPRGIRVDDRISLIMERSERVIEAELVVDRVLWRPGFYALELRRRGQE